MKKKSVSKTKSILQKIGLKAEFSKSGKSAKISKNCQTLIFLAPEEQKLIGVILPEGARPDTKKIRKITNAKKIRFLRKSEREAFFGFPADHIPAVALLEMDFRFMDQSLSTLDFVIGSAGTKDEFIKFSPAEFRKKMPELKTFDLVRESEPPAEKPEDFKFKREEIPTTAGCYLFFDKNEELLYVGKAKNLRKRVASYFQKTAKSLKTDTMMKKIARIETRAVHSEIEALILENNLIKEFRPRFNILLRDDKNFLYLKITKQDFPRLEITRNIVRDGSFYLGPKTSAKSFRQTINFCQKVFQIRTCRLEIQSSSAEDNIRITKNPEKRKIPCLDFHIKKCSGPCDNQISLAQYRENIETMKRFLRGDSAQVLKNLQKKMMTYAKEKNFEAAAKIRDLIASIQISTEKQTVQFSDRVARDFIHFYRDETRAYGVRNAFRAGKFLDQNEVEFSVPEAADDTDILEKFLVQFYERVDEPPREIYIPKNPRDKEKIEAFLSRQFDGQKIEILIPQKGDKTRILEMAKSAARHFFERKKLENLSHAENFAKALPQLAEALGLQTPPKRLEAYDISHFGGQATVGSRAVFIDGEPAKSEYRKYHIQSLPAGTIDDFSAMKEMLARRFKSITSQKKSEKKRKIEQEKKNFPDLIVIDGGKGQLSAVMKIFDGNLKPKNFNPKTQIIALAKREEEIFIPGKKEPIELPADSAASKLLQRIRDEAHRFAVGFNRSTRDKQAKKSLLDRVPGIGETTKQKLLKIFGSVKKIKTSTDEDLLKILNKKQLKNLQKVLKMEAEN